ncbi:MAG: tautomerase family protein [Acidobacteriota bacterium]
MPLVRVSIREAQPPAFRAAIGDGIHRAMVSTIDIPPDDRFQIFSEHREDELIYDPGYLGIARGAGFLVIQITLNGGRTLEKKRALYAAIAENLAADPGVRPEDILVTLVEVSKEDWSFGKGLASYASPPSPSLTP